MSCMHKDIENQIKLSFACPMSWEAMPGTDKERSCAKCSCTVQNITDYTSEARRDLQNRIDAGEKICVAMPEAAPTASALDVCRQVLRDYAALRYGAMAGKIAGIALSACLLFGSFTCKPAIAEPYKTHIQYSDKQFYKDKAGCYFFLRPVPDTWMGEASRSDLNDLGSSLLATMERSEKAEDKDKIPVLASPVARRFKEEFNHGILSQRTLDDFARECTDSGQFELSARIQSISRLIERSGEPLQEPAVSPRSRNNNSVKERFQKLLKEVDENTVKSPIDAMNDLIDLVRFRSCYREINNEYFSKALTERYDKLEALLPSPVLRLKLALGFAPLGEEETVSKDASQWKQAQQVKLATLRQKVIAESDKQAKEKDYNGAYESLEQAAEVRGPLITLTEQKLLTDRLLDLMPSLDLSKGIECIELLDRIATCSRDNANSVLDLNRFQVEIKTLIDNFLKIPLPHERNEQAELGRQFIALVSIHTYTLAGPILRERSQELRNRLGQLAIQTDARPMALFEYCIETLNEDGIFQGTREQVKERCTALISDQMKLYNHFRDKKKWSEALSIQLSMRKLFRYNSDLTASPQYKEFLNHYLEIASEADKETIRTLWQSFKYHLSNHYAGNQEQAREVAKLASDKIYDRLFVDIDSEIHGHNYKEAMDNLNEIAKLVNTSWAIYIESAGKHGLIPTEKIAARMKSIRDKVDPLDAALIDYWIEFYKF
ncbi:MAG: hypothetical protein SFV17_10515 [Candidatus Obscuribacter sp.]|nr:hypothetical protein [Candidatus Obscuribacter sp.]